MSTLKRVPLRRFDRYKDDPASTVLVHLTAITGNPEGMVALLSLPDRGIPTLGTSGDAEPHSRWDLDLKWCGYQRVSTWAWNETDGWHAEVIG